MEQEKIGKFIAKLRKENNLTQLELANKLGITDRAISKWENGRGLPDLSLMIPLCDELKVSVNELLSGERLNKDEYEKKIEENIVNTINYADDRISKFKKIIKIIITFILLLFITLLIMFFIDIKRMKNNEPVLFSTWGYDYAPPIDLSFEEIEIAIENYLIKKSDSEVKHYDNEKGFASFRTYLIEEKKKKSFYNIYAFVMEEKYYLEKGEIKKDSGSAIPYKFVVEVIDSKYVVTDSRIPRDGALYHDDMKNIFPKSVRNDMDNIYYDGTIDRLQLEIQKQVKLYFHK